jgi:hypothetical protein
MCPSNTDDFDMNAKPSFIYEVKLCRILATSNLIFVGVDVL